MGLSLSSILSSIFVLTGDLNTLDYSSLLVNFGFSQIVTSPTRNANLLDVFITNRPDLFSCTVARSLVTSDHLAVFVNCFGSNVKAVDANRESVPRRRVKCYSRLHKDEVRLHDFFASYNWNGLLNGINDRTITVDQAFTEFVNIMHYALDTVLGFKTVTVRKSDPTYITPEIRILLRRRNRIMGKGQIAEAELLTRDIGRLIALVKANLLSNASSKNTKELWQLLRSTNNWPGKSSVSGTSTPTEFTASELNSYFANIATDPNYSASAVADAVQLAECQQRRTEHNNSNTFLPYTEDHITIILEHIKPTAPGPEAIPSWVYKTFAIRLGPIVCKLINYSIEQSCVPITWRTAHVTPVPKTQPIANLSDFRPISVTSLLSRLTERLIVRDYLVPYLTPHLFYDQYAYKPTGSTTCALVDFTHRIHSLLETNQYVRCVFIDFSKAFDMVDHPTLITKLAGLQIPAFVIKWITSFLSNRTQATRYNFDLSSLISITRSIIQGSGIGPILFIIFACDLKPLDALNLLLKYADDSTLLCPEHTTTPIEDEVRHVIKWAALNKLLINLLKTKEMVFHRPNPRHMVFPPEIPDIARVNSFRLLGIQINPELKLSDYIDSMITVCNQRLYLLTQLKRQGLGLAETDNVFKAIILNKITYALPVVFGYLTEYNKQQISAIFHKARKWQLTNSAYDFENTAMAMQFKLFQQSKSTTHCLNHLYTPTHNTSNMQLRDRGHNFHIPQIRFEFNSKSFINRCLLQYR